MTLAIRFQVLPATLETRVKAALQALRDGHLTDIQAMSFFFKYFFQRLAPMYRDAPQIARTIQEAVKNQLVGLVVPNLVDVTLHITTITDLQFTRGVPPKSPSMGFADLQVVEDVILAKTTLPQALIEKKVKVKKLGDILRWLAPISTIQTEETLVKVRNEDLAILEKNLHEIGF
ncbi:MAG: hypothetical protein LUQ65_05210 [Candidatus Helarchaeota archaeon]|nr:hypothetical protein [Candidatus Helarchaeota archaeon]